MTDKTNNKYTLDADWDYIACNIEKRGFDGLLVQYIAQIMDVAKVTYERDCVHYGIRPGVKFPVTSYTEYVDEALSLVPFQASITIENDEFLMNNWKVTIMIGESNYYKGVSKVMPRAIVAAVVRSRGLK